MHQTKLRTQAALFASLLILGCSTKPAPEAAAPPDISAAAPAGARLYTIGPAQWEDAVCSGDSAMTVDVPAGEWVALPVGWYASDEATARANWEHMQYGISLDGRALQIPEGVQSQVDSVHYECPNRTISGVAVSPVVYLPPSDAERHYTVRYTFDDQVNDGWNTFDKGTDFSWTLTLRPGG
ncbi:MAG: hypothetical protein LJF04_08460 [Gemmatimonadetes bacterium]|nr:hypothetical protein [Gemmatimonadota bacterium]